MSQQEQFKVVGNQHGHISLWPRSRVNALGWVDAGFEGSRQDCLDHIDASLPELTGRVAAAFAPA
jgi:uncharacterized protein YbdZ (MbtH family)